jgi:hypothetical protein
MMDADPRLTSLVSTPSFYDERYFTPLLIVIVSLPVYLCGSTFETIALAMVLFALGMNLSNVLWERTVRRVLPPEEP